ncbi:MAG: Gfo/Idh/MocA family oxidoreductase [Candidatus Hydrogenedentes bacterium]|nr:Gfo/Idh/MocA family oxidoreductase [Candidatus Hydrogenedentota bacterium]
MSRLGVAVVGCGGMAHSVHLPAIALLRDDLKLVAVCDREPVCAEETAARYGVRPYTDLERMLGEQDRIDFVVVTVHAQHHHTVAIEAARAGKHILVEKPIAVSLPCASAMLVACQKNMVKIEVAENYLRMPMDAFINEVIRSGALGPIRAVSVTDPVNGCSIDIGVHRHSQLREAAGGWPVAISAIMARPEIVRPEPSERFQEREFGDTCGVEWSVAMVDFDNGVAGKCEHLPLSKEALVWSGDLRTVIGDEGGVADDLWPNVWPWKSEGQLTVKRWRGHGGHEALGVRRTDTLIHGRAFAERIELEGTTPVVWENPALEQVKAAPSELFEAPCAHGRQTWADWFTAEVSIYKSFACAIRENTAPWYGGDRGRNDLELTVATYESARLGQRLTLPLTAATAHDLAFEEAFQRRYGRSIL